MSSILITGAGNGLGQALAVALQADGHTVWSYDIGHGYDVRTPDLNLLDRIGHIDVLVNNAGVNEIDYLDNFTEDQWDRVMGVNAKGIYMMTRAALPWLIESKGTVLNIVSNAAHIPMTCSLAYNASKGAAHIMTLQLARELTRRYGITVFGVAPNKLAGTNMSRAIDDQVMVTRGWTREYTEQYQRQSLLTGEETQPAQVAEFIAFLLQDKDHHKSLTGCVLPYGA